MKFVSKSIENRIENLDFIRGVAILGILIMNSMVFALPESANWNHSSSGADSYFDWILIFFAVIFIDGKMMGLFSILFGAGLLLFVDSAKKKGYKRPVMLSLWRNLLLLLFGILPFVLLLGKLLAKSPYPRSSLRIKMILGLSKVVLQKYI